MYEVIKHADGVYTARVNIQGDNICHDFPTEAKAVASVILSAKYGNHDTITRKDISFLREEKVMVEQARLVSYKPRKRK